MTTAEIIKKLASEDLPPTTMNARRLFGSFSCMPKPRPLSILPNELLSEIFLFATQNSEDRCESILIPIIVSQVSTRWRNVAISTSMLWNTIILTFPTSRQQLSRALTWLKRSRWAPLDVFLDFRDPSWDWDLAESSHTFRWQDMEAILRLLMTHVHRWKRLELLTDTWAPIFTFLCYTRHVKSIPILESLSLHRCNAFFASKGVTFTPVEMRKPVQLFGGHAAEQLREVTLTGVHVNWATSPLLNLTKLELRYLASDVTPSMDEFTTILTGCPKLRQLTIIGRGPRIDDMPTPGPSSSVDAGSDGLSSKLLPVIELPHVTSFVFGFIDTDYAVRLLARLSLPALSDLTLEGLVDLDPLVLHDLDATPVLERLILCSSHSKSTCSFPLSNIHSLKLIAINSNTTTFLRLFNDLDKLDHLGLFKTKSDALQALVPSSSDSPAKIPPCATLAGLECHYMNSTILLDVVLARAQFKRINEVSLLSDEISAEYRDKLLDAGVKLYRDISQLS